MTAATWIALLSLAVAGGSLAAAVGLYRINRQALGDEWAREWAAQRPVVYPVALRDWVYPGDDTPYRGGNQRLLPIKNGGRGPALNVRGTVTAIPPDGGAEYTREIYAGTIAAGDLMDARVVPAPGVVAWGTVHGVLRYRDLVGAEWETKFEFRQVANELELTAHEPVSIEADVTA